MTLEEQLKQLETRVTTVEVLRDEQAKVYMPMFTQVLKDVGLLTHTMGLIQAQVTNHLPTIIAFNDERIKAVEAKLWWVVTLLVANLAAVTINAFNLYVTK